MELTLIVPALKRLRQEDCPEFEVNLQSEALSLKGNKLRQKADLEGYMKSGNSLSVFSFLLPNSLCVPVCEGEKRTLGVLFHYSAMFL